MSDYKCAPLWMIEGMEIRKNTIGVCREIGFGTSSSLNEMRIYQLDGMDVCLDRIEWIYFAQERGIVCPTSRV